MSGRSQSYQPARQLAGEAAARFLASIDVAREAFAREDWTGALAGFRDAWDLDPQNADLLVVISHLLSVLGARTLAVDVLGRALEANGASREVLGITGRLALDMSMHDIAERLFLQYMELFPDDPSAVNGYANALGAQGLYDEAISFLQSAIPVMPDAADLWNTLGSMVSARDGAAASAPFFGEAARLSPRDFRIRNNLSKMYAALDAHEEALAEAEAAIALAPNEPEPQLGRALTLLSLGRLEEGFAAYEARNHKGRKGYVRFLALESAPRWQGEDLSGKRIALIGEQGIGDELLFGSVVPQLLARGAEIELAVERRLVPAFSRSFPGVAVSAHQTMTRAGHTIRSCPAFSGADYCDLLASAAGRLWAAGEIGKGGYLLPPPAEKPTGRMRVGVSWRSGLMKGDRRHGYLEVGDLAPLMALDDVDFISLQYDDCAEELDALRSLCGRAPEVTAGLDQKQDLEGVFGLLSTLDLVIGPATAPAMMAMAIGVPVWWLVKSDPWWRFGTDHVPFHIQGRYVVARSADDMENLAQDLRICR